MLGTYASFAAIVLASACVGQAIFGICGRRAYSFGAPAVGLAAITALAWATARLPGEGTAAAISVGVLTAIALAFLVARPPESEDALAGAVAPLVLVLVVASLPFIVEGRFGILGTGLNPDMSQHLFAADRLAAGEGSRLAAQGYPLGPHALVVAAAQVTGASLVHAFDGLTLAIAASATLAPLGLLGRLQPWRRTVGALLVGVPYLVAAYLVQGAFKETMQALFLLAFAIGLHQLATGVPAAEPRRRVLAAEPRRRVLAAVPLAVIAIGSIYTYSFPGLLWLAGAAGVWGVVELVATARRRSVGAALDRARAAAAPLAIAAAVLAAAAAPEIGRMAEFAGFETFDPQGAGVGNLFDPISPLEALGIWPSGDFRLDPGEGAMPPIGFYLGELLGLAALAYGLAWWLRRSEWAVPSALAAATALYAYAHFAGTPYQAAKAIVIASPLAMLLATRALLSPQGIVELGAIRGAIARTRTGPTGSFLRHEPRVHLLLAIAFCAAALACTVLAFVNGPVGPTTYTPALTELRSRLGASSTLVLVPEHVLADEHGRDYVVWELRGGRVCVEAQGSEGGSAPPGIAHVVTGAGDEPPYTDVRLERRSGPYALWKRAPAPTGEGPCPLIAVGARANPASD